MSLSIRTKLLSGFALVLILLAACVGLAITKMGAMNDKTKVISGIDLPSVNTIGDINATQSNFRTAQYRSATSTDAAALADAEKALRDRNAAIQKSFTSYERYVGDARDRELWQTARRQWTAYVDGTKNVDQVRDAIFAALG